MLGTGFGDSDGGADDFGFSGLRVEEGQHAVYYEEAKVPKAGAQEANLLNMSNFQSEVI